MGRISQLGVLWTLLLMGGAAKAITIEVASGECEAVQIAAAHVRDDLAKVCPEHVRDARRIVVKTTGEGGWESSVRTYSNGVWTIAGADRRGTVYGVYAISEALGVSPFYWWDDIPIPTHSLSDLAVRLSTHRFEIASPAVKYRGIFINDEDWCLRPWATENFEKDATKSIGAKTYEKIFEMMSRARLNVIWPAMHGCERSYEFVTRPENMALADRMGIVVGTSHCEPMLRNNVFWNKQRQGEWNYATNRAEIDKYWQWAVDRYGKNEVLWTIGIRGTHDEPMNGGNTMAGKVELMEKVFATQTNMLSRAAAKSGCNMPAMNFIPYKEVLPIYDAGLKVPKGSSIMWVDDNFGYIRRLGGPGATDHPGGIYWHVSYFGWPHSYTHTCTTSPGFLWYELGAKCMDNNARETWVLNVGDIKPADLLIGAFAKVAWDPASYGPMAQTKLLTEWAATFLGPKQNDLVPRLVKHLNDYYQLGMIRRPELMSVHWVKALSSRARTALMARYVALEREDVALEQVLAPAHRDAWFSAQGYQVRFLSTAGRYFMSDDYLDASGRERVQAEINALSARYDTIFGGKWKGFWFDTIVPPRGWSDTPNNWWSQMQWPWKESPEGWPYKATAGSQGTESCEWIDAADATRISNTKTGGWQSVDGLGISGRAMALLPVKEGAGVGAAMEYEIDWQGNVSERAELVLQFLPDYRLYPGLKLRVGVEVNGGAHELVEVPYSDGARDERGDGRDVAVQDNFVRAFVGCGNLKRGINRVKITAVDPGVVIDRIAVYLRR